MSKLYTMRRMSSSPAAGGLLTGLLGGAAKAVGNIFQSKGTKALIAAGKSVLSKPVIQTGLLVGGAELASGLLRGGGGSSGSWSGRRRGRGITATELRGFRKVANLIHKEGMVSSRARGRKH